MFKVFGSCKFALSLRIIRSTLRQPQMNTNCHKLFVFISAEFSRFMVCEKSLFAWREIQSRIDVQWSSAAAL